MAHIGMNDGKLVIRDDWYIEDILSQAENMEVDITEEDAIKIMEMIVEFFDANVGINWEVIDACIEQYMEESK